MSTPKLQISGLEFDEIKSNLKDFLRSQTTFKDYDFDGSALNILIETLAFNTYYNSFYLNMIANEMTLDTAVIRDTILAHAKFLNYVPHSRKSAEALVDIIVTPPDGNTQSTLTLEKYHPFQSESIDGVNYSFVTTESIVVSKEDGVFTFSDVTLMQGTPQSLTFTYDPTAYTTPEFELPHDTINTNTISVLVQKSSVDTSTEVFTVSDDITSSVDGSVFFLETSTDNKYKIVFGDGRSSKPLANGNILLVSYLLSDGDLANKANSFATIPIEGYSNINILPITSAAGGAERESDASIKINAPMFNASQNRAITTQDYASLVLKNYPSIRSVSVWGGEDNIPETFNTVFISYLPQTGVILNQTEKRNIIDNIIKPLAVIGSNHIIVDPDYMYLKFISTVNIDERATSLSFSQIETLVKSTISNFVDDHLNVFDSIFASSKLESEVDRSLTAILGSDMKTRVEKRLLPTPNTALTYDISFGIPLNRASVTTGLHTSGFYVYDQTAVKRLAYIEEVTGSSTGIDSIEIINPGYGYKEVPEVIITGDGVGATAVAEIVNGQINNIMITNRGIGYTTASISFSGIVGGLDAQATATISAKYGNLRLFYYKSNAEKETLDPEIGTIDYETGQISLGTMTIDSTTEADGTIRFVIEPQLAIFKTKRNQLLTVDKSDPSSIIVSVRSV